jgi:hypothetical protein
MTPIQVALRNPHTPHKILLEILQKIGSNEAYGWYDSCKNLRQVIDDDDLKALIWAAVLPGELPVATLYNKNYYWDELKITPKVHELVLEMLEIGTKIEISKQAPPTDVPVACLYDADCIKKILPKLSMPCLSWLGEGSKAPFSDFKIFEAARETLLQKSKVRSNQDYFKHAEDGGLYFRPLPHYETRPQWLISFFSRHV